MIEMLDALRGVVNNMNWIDEGSEFQLAYILNNLPEIFSQLQDEAERRYGSVEELISEYQDELESF